jgi:hypothetical protein
MHLLLHKYHEYGAFALECEISSWNSSYVIIGFSLRELGSKKNAVVPAMTSITENTK